MEETVTNTQNGDSRKYRLPEERVNEYKNATEGCKIQFTAQIDVAPVGFDTTAKDFTCQVVPPAKTIESGILPEKQGASLITTGAAEMSRQVTIVVDGSGRVSEARTAKEDGSRKAARESQEIEESAERKYAQNQEDKANGQDDKANGQDENSAR